MIHEPEMVAIEDRAHAARVTMTELCRQAGKHRSSWFRARKRGRAEYSLIEPIEQALLSVEARRDKLREHMREAAAEAWRAGGE